jgi:nucleoside-diphosphate kinase
MEQTLFLFKPDALERGLVGIILNRLERAGLRIVNCGYFCPDIDFLKRHYADLENRNPVAFERSTRCMADKPFLAFVFEGINAVQKIRAFVGATDPCKAPLGTIRGDFSSDSFEQADRENRATLNLVHASDSRETAEQEIALWFPTTK